MKVDHRAQMQKINANTTTEQRKERAKKGAVKRAETLKKRKAMKEMLNILMEMPVTDENILTVLKDMGIDADDLNNQTAILVATMKKAQSGDMRAVEYIAQMLGENGEQKVNVSGNIPVIISGGDKLED